MPARAAHSGSSKAQRGYFSDDSMIRRVMRKRAVGLTYGQRALVIGAVHPLLYVGTAENTQHRTTPYTRLGLAPALAVAFAGLAAGWLLDRSRRRPPALGIDTERELAPTQSAN